MEVLNVPPDYASYSISDIGSVLYQPLDGGSGRQRVDMLDANRLVTVQWTTRLNFNYLRNFYKSYLGRNCEPFLISLFSGSGELVSYIATFVTFQPIASQDGLTYAVTAQLEIEPVDAEDGTFWVPVITWTPQMLFQNGESGGFWDFTDSTTLWANSTLTVPVNIGDVIVGVTDKSGNNRHLINSGGSTLFASSGGITYANFTNGGLFSTSSGKAGGSAGWTNFAGFRPTSTRGSLVDSDLAAGRVNQWYVQSGSPGLMGSVTFSADTSYIQPSAYITLDSSTNYSGLLERSPTFANMYVNNTLVNSTVFTKNPAYFTNTTIKVGVSFAGTNDPIYYVFHGRMYYAGSINRILTPTEKGLLNTWAVARL